MTQMTGNELAANLRLLCSFEKSTSAICREIGINRQQFNKYLNSTSIPSPYNMQRICEYFRIGVSDIYLPPDVFAERMRFRSNGSAKPVPADRHAPVLKSFGSNPASLRRYLGYYITYSHSFSWTGYLVVGVSRIYENQGFTCTKSLERIRDPADGTIYRSKYDGQAALLGNRIFVVEYQSLANDAIIETVLYPAARTQLTLLRGVTFGISNKQRQPYVSRCIWKFIGANVDLRTLVREPCLLQAGSKRVDPKIEKILGDKPFPNSLLHYDLEPYGLS
jgi:transcriptional regulator with XRE-family HTH domain